MQARRWAALLAATVLLAAPGCAKSKSADKAQRLGTEQPDGPTTTGGAGSATTAKPGTATTAKPGTPTTANARTGTTNTTARSTGTTNTTNGTADTGAKGGAGAYARTLLRPSPATRVVLEFMPQSGATPLAHTTSHAQQVVSANAQKTVAVSSAPVPGAAQDFTAEQIDGLADQYSRSAQSATQAVVHVLFLHGTYEGDNSVLGISVRGDTAAVFIDQVMQSATAVAPRSTIEDAVTEHELGHLLGLVDLVLHTGRGDPDHPGHSRNRNSVMYWAVESDLVSQLLGGPPPVDFDDADRADLATIRNGG